MHKRAIVLGCEGTKLTADEKAFYKETNPFGFILFARNVENPEQLRALTDEMRNSVGDETVPVLIDQEGGRVRRLRPPHWRDYPAMRLFGDRFNDDPRNTAEALHLTLTLMSQDLLAAGITVNCAPVLDVPIPGSNEAVLGDRAFAEEPFLVSGLGQVAVDAFLANGILPVIKHLPGHGRAMCDSHKELPRVEATYPELQEQDFLPFRALRKAPLGMTGHILFRCIDGDNPATTSERVIREIIRGEIGFEGLLFSDDLSMEALQGDFKQRASASLKAGCDVVLHCNGKMSEMTAAVEGSAPLTESAIARWQHAQSLLPEKLDADTSEIESRLAELMA